jgi:hypothetical protein
MVTSQTHLPTGSKGQLNRAIGMPEKCLWDMYQGPWYSSDHERSCSDSTARPVSTVSSVSSFICFKNHAYSPIHMQAVILFWFLEIYLHIKFLVSATVCQFLCDYHRHSKSHGNHIAGIYWSRIQDIFLHRYCILTMRKRMLNWK